eukprot:CAMPEP_0172178592 /NCGR_PEP_ID=MMETSP1050-20130122/16129_1 /TAXON_ID=233186 /ORGANISM="Cryptomonas curvata, Strain CCAP979/52" /LENGTH=504 /DNA_ID=CAMNT_0012851343 /DNA_START=67 /DNA_END=1581 /DNA_ORIENTATION=+
MSSTSLVSSFSPSLCNEGFVHDDSRGPLLLGTGFGSKPYQVLYDRWTKIQNTKQKLHFFSDEQANFARILLDQMRSCQESKLNKAVFSGFIANSLQQLIPTFDADGTRQNSMVVLHQTCVPDDSSWSVDISIMDGLKTQSSVHAMLEVRWKFEEEKFPQSQGSAYAPLFVNSGSCIHRWLPVFVLSKDHFQFGVAFDGINSRWAYSEICHFICPRRNFTPTSSDDVLSILQFAQFFAETAIYHLEFKNDVPEPHIVDKFGEVIILHPSVVFGRVLHGFSILGESKILKLYADLNSARAALAKQEAIQKILKYGNKAELKEGCDPRGMFAVLHEYCVSTPSITLEHVEELARQVDILHKEHFVHGDIRLPNIMFSEDQAVTLIDFEWSGRVGEAVFPAGARVSAFGPTARNFVRPGEAIHPLFDWMCLADLLDTMQLYAAAAAARKALVNTVIAEIKAQRNDGIDLFSLLHPGPQNLDLQFDLSTLGIPFYLKRRSACHHEQPGA